MSAARKAPYEKRLAGLKRERESFLAHWREISSFMLPRRGRFLDPERNRGGKLNQRIINNTATLALRTLAHGMMAGLTSPARPWFRLATSDPMLMERAEVKDWLHVVQRLMMATFNRSNLYNVLPTVYSELGAFGTGAMLTQPDSEAVVRFYALTAGEYVIGQNERLSVDTLYREFRMTVGQLVNMFGQERVSERTRAAYENGQVDQWVDIVHAIEPNDHRDSRFRDTANMPFRSVWYEKGGDAQRLLRESGYRSFPCQVPRWDLLGGDFYGRSPAMDALGDVKQLQTQERQKGEAIERNMKPPLQGPANGTMKAHVVQNIPGGYTAVTEDAHGNGVRPIYQVRSSIGEISADIQLIEQRIRRALYEDLFLMLLNSDRRQITAREIAERHEEKLTMLGPVLERLQEELLDPVIDQTFELMMEAGRLPPPPEVLGGQELKVDYVSVLAQAQKMVGLGALEQVAAFVGSLAGAKPEVLDKFNADEAVENFGEMLGLPPNIILSEETVRLQRAERLQALEEAGQLLASGDGKGPMQPGLPPGDAE